jgi:hypothetical protein
MKVAFVDFVFENRDAIRLEGCELMRDQSWMAGKPINRVASGGTNYVSGVTIPVDGGFLAR